LRAPRGLGRHAWASLVVGLVLIAPLISSSPARALGSDDFSVPSSAKQLIVVSSRSYDPPGYLATFRTFQRANASSPWKPVFKTWRAEIGSGDLVNVRHFGDHATPTGVFTIALRMYGNQPNPGGLHYAYHRLVCGDWWDEDPYSSEYNQFVHVPCGTTPSFGSWSEALWTETLAYPYLAVLKTNNDPTISGSDAPGAGIFLHHWMSAPTEGCVALPLGDLLHVLRWLRPGQHPVIEIGTDAEIGRLAKLAAAPVARRGVTDRHQNRATAAARVSARNPRLDPRSRRARDVRSGLNLETPLIVICAVLALFTLCALRARRAPGRRSAAHRHTRSAI
jgi:L,D-peptidoglycan transpeptidase YkuD (ErfK/YbiS/YcfS/YnhG family)